MYNIRYKSKDKHYTLYIYIYNIRYKFKDKHYIYMYNIRYKSKDKYYTLYMYNNRYNKYQFTGIYLCEQPLGCSLQ